MNRKLKHQNTVSSNVKHVTGRAQDWSSKKGPSAEPWLFAWKINGSKTIHLLSEILKRFRKWKKDFFLRIMNLFSKVFFSVKTKDILCITINQILSEWQIRYPFWTRIYNSIFMQYLCKKERNTYAYYRPRKDPKLFLADCIWTKRFLNFLINQWLEWGLQIRIRT